MNRYSHFFTSILVLILSLSMITNAATASNQVNNDIQPNSEELTSALETQHIIDFETRPTYVWNFVNRDGDRAYSTLYIYFDANQPFMYRGEVDIILCADPEDDGTYSLQETYTLYTGNVAHIILPYGTHTVNYQLFFINQSTSVTECTFTTILEY